MTCFQQRSAYDYCLVLDWRIQFPDYDCEVLRNIWVKANSFGISGTDDTGDLLLDSQYVGVNGKFGNDVLGKARSEVGCEMGNGTESRRYRDAN